MTSKFLASNATAGLGMALAVAVLVGAPPMAVAAPQAICVPWIPAAPAVPHFTYSGASVRLKGIARDGATEFRWEFGDGGSTAWAAIANVYNLEATHTYTGFVGQVFIATLFVRDAASQVAQDDYPVQIHESSNLADPVQLDVRINMAIDEGLWWLHKTMIRGDYGGGSPGYNQPYGSWNDPGGYPLPATAAAFDAFQLHGSRANGDYAGDPYVETVQRAINYLLYNTYSFNITNQTHGNPDSPGPDGPPNGIGLVANRNGNLGDGAQTYIGGICMAALASSGAPNRVALVGRDNVVNRTYAAIVQDMVDFFAYGQVDSGASHGGWRYSANASESDMSTTQWPVLGMAAAEHNMGAFVPAFVRDELVFYLNYSQHTVCDNDNGGYGYTTTGDYINCTKAGAGLICREFLGTSLAIETTQSTFGFLYRHWNDAGTSWGYQRLLGNSYGMYGVMKAMRLPEPDVLRITEYDCTTHLPTANSFDWYYATTAEPREGLAHYLVRTQQADGSWDDTTPAPNPLYDAFATGWRVLILLKGVTILPPEAIICDCAVQEYDINQDIHLDGSCSFHPDSARHIVSYEWDFEYDGVTFVADAAGEHVVKTGGYTDYGIYPVALRVTDDNPAYLGGPQSDIYICSIDVHPPPHCPHACAGGPYIGWVNQPVELDATCSWDPNGDIVGFAWDLDTNGTADYDEAFTAIASWTCPKEKTYSFCVQVTDANSCSMADCTTVECGNHAPICDAGGPYDAPTNGTIYLVGCASYDPDPDDYAMFAWDLDHDGEFDDSSMCNPTFTAGPNVGEVYTVCLKVIDTFGKYSICCTTVTAIRNTPPVAECRDVTKAAGGDCCAVFTAADIDDGSYDHDGPEDIVSRCISAVDGVPADCLPEVRFCGVGSHVLTLTVTDSYGANDSCDATVTLQDQTAPQPAVCAITNPEQPIGVNADCEAIVNFSVTLTDNCCIDPSSVQVTATLLTANATLGAVVLDPLPPSGPAVTVTGHVSVFDLTCCPAQVQIDATAKDCAGQPAAPCSTTVYIVDDYPPAGACGLSRDNAGQNWVDNQIVLTANEPAYWSAFSGLPKGVAPFPSLDAGYLPGRPDPDSPQSADRVLRGYVMAWAVSATGEEIRWNHLAGDALIVNYAEGSAWAYESYAFQAISSAVPNGGLTGTPGELHLDGSEYQNAFGQLVLDFYAVAAPAFSGGGHSVAVDTDLTLLPLLVDLRQDDAGPATTKANFDVFNMNEVKFSGTHRCVQFWDQCLLSNYDPPNHFLPQNLQTDKGRARIDGLASTVCPNSAAAPLLGVQMKALAFDGDLKVERSGTPLVGAGTETGLVRYDVGNGEPPEKPAGAGVVAPGVRPRPAQAVALAENTVLSTDLTRSGASQKGSLLVFPKVEIRWDHCGNLIQDTFLDLTNDYPGDVQVKLYFINGDAPQPAQLPRCIIPEKQ